MKTILETERLLLRQFEQSDAAFILDLLNTDGWLRYIGDRNVRTTEDAEKYLAEGPLNNYRENGFGLWAAVRKEDHLLLGMCGIIRRKTLEHPDIGFAFLPDHNGKGYAAESVAATVQYALQTLNLPCLLAITLPENVPSINLLKKSGFHLQGEMIWEDTGETLLSFAITKNL